ncbi:hypothetical protein [Pseudomonas argentinensis]|nr:hypothetical protein [Pseudomonas argentinensis]
MLLTSNLPYLISRRLGHQARIGTARRASEERLSLALSATEDGLRDLRR